MAALPFDSDNGPGTRATIGIVVLQTDEAMEGDLRAFLPLDGVALHHTRIPFEPTVTAETLAKMEADLGAAVAMLPASAPFDVIGYGCTSGSAVIGENKIAEQIQSVYPQAQATNPLSASKAALKALSATRLALVTPYIPAVSETLRQKLEEAGIATPILTSFEQVEDASVARISPHSIRDAIIQTGKGQQVDAVFAACTNLRSASIIRQCEDALGLPVVTSNQALAWHMMRLAGLRDAIPALGRLGDLAISP